MRIDSRRALADAPLDTRTSPLDCLVVAPPFAARSAASLACFSCASSVSRRFIRPRFVAVVRRRARERRRLGAHLDGEEFDHRSRARSSRVVASRASNVTRRVTVASHDSPRAGRRAMVSNGVGRVER